MTSASSKMLSLVLSVLVCLRTTVAHLIPVIPPPTQYNVVPVPVPISLYRVPVYAPHHTGAIIAAGPHAAVIGPAVIVSYNTAQGTPVVAVPLKFFGRFPPFIEGIVQRIQNYFSTYNNIEDLTPPPPPAQQDPVQPTNTTTTAAPTTTTLTTTLAPVTESAEPGDIVVSKGRHNYGPSFGYQRFTLQDMHYPRS
ncbi:hypothetical protein C0J52_24405 [Blattella germanica]|nr:hypothetical protein C0J52_24405 [Blattella germanica]